MNIGDRASRNGKTSKIGSTDDFQIRKVGNEKREKIYNKLRQLPYIKSIVGVLTN